MKNDQGEDVSTIEIKKKKKKILETIIAEEDKNKPLPDEDLAQILKEKRVSYCKTYHSKI